MYFIGFPSEPRRFAIAIKEGARSIPVQSAPKFASFLVKTPWPQPRSTIFKFLKSLSFFEIKGKSDGKITC